MLFTDATALAGVAATVDLDALPGTTIPGSAVSGFVFPRSVAGSKAASFAAPGIFFVWDRRPPRAAGLKHPEGSPGRAAGYTAPAALSHPGGFVIMGHEVRFMKTFRIGAAGMALVLAGGALVPVPLSAQKKDRDLITREELLGSAQKSRDLYQAILSLRPHFLAPLSLRSTEAARQATGPSRRSRWSMWMEPGEGTSKASSRSWRRMSRKCASSDPPEAALQYGSDHAGGAIMVKLHKSSKPETAGDQTR